MKAELPASKASRDVSSLEVGSSGEASDEWASLPITSSASSVGFCSRSSSSGLLRIEVPALSIISSQVFGGFGTRSLRYQRSCVLVLNGDAYSSPSKLAVFSTLGKTSFDA